MRISKLNQERWLRFKANRRGFISLWIFLFFFILSLFAEVIANDVPLMIRFDHGLYLPLFKQYAETEFGGEFENGCAGDAGQNARVQRRGRQTASSRQRRTTGIPTSPI